jgi:hypothetical protein
MVHGDKLPCSIKQDGFEWIMNKSIERGISTELFSFPFFARNNCTKSSNLNNLYDLRVELGPLISLCMQSLMSISEDIRKLPSSTNERNIFLCTWN